MDFRRLLGGLGSVFIGAGVLILLFVAYQLWGTGIHESRSQDGLRSEFEQALSTTSSTAPGAAPVAPPAPPQGEAVAIIKIPKIGLEKAIVEGVGVSDLKKGPGHYPSTPLPGQPGNSAIAGHRTTYGGPFNRIDELHPGDPVLVTTRQGNFRYEVTERRIVPPTFVEVLKDTPDDRLTLTTCEPKFSAAKRLIITAALKGDAAPAPEEKPDAAAPAAEPDQLDAGLSGDPTARGPAFIWGLAAAITGFLVWLWGRYWRRWPAYLLGTPAFLVVLFMFFENFARLLPANV